MSNLAYARVPVTPRERPVAGDTHEGYANRETWALCLWLANDQGLYEQAVEYASAYASDETFPPLTEATDYALGTRYLDDTRAQWDEYLLDGGAPREFLTMIEDIGSWWRIDAAEVGAFLRRLVDDSMTVNDSDAPGHVRELAC